MNLDGGRASERGVIKRARYNKRDTISEINVTTAFINNQQFDIFLCIDESRIQKKKKKPGEKAFQPCTPQKSRHCNAEKNIRHGRFCFCIQMDCDRVV